MPRFNVYLYPEMIVQITDIEAETPREAITQAIAAAKQELLNSDGDSRAGPVFVDEFLRYVVDPLVGKDRDYRQSETFLDELHLQADEKDRQDGLPVYGPSYEDS